MRCPESSQYRRRKNHFPSETQTASIIPISTAHQADPVPPYHSLLSDSYWKEMLFWRQIDALELKHQSQTAWVQIPGLALTSHMT